MTRNELLSRLRSGWSMYRVGAIGTGLPFACWLIMAALIEWYALHAGWWFVATFFVCPVEGFAFHAKKGAINILERPAGALWAYYGMFGLVALAVVCRDIPGDIQGIIRVHAGLSLFFLSTAIGFFFAAVFSPPDRGTPAA